MIKDLLKPLASLKLTVALLILSMLLVYAGTWAQVDAGIWQVQKQYFHSFYTWVQFQTLFPRPGPGHARIPFGFPLPGGYTLCALLLVNLLAAHVTRFKFTWKRSGVILIHVGLALLLVGELVTSVTQVETQMRIDEGQTVNYSSDTRTVELAIVDPSPERFDMVASIPQSALEGKDAVVQHKLLPFDVKVEQFMPNSRPLGPFEQDQAGPAPFGVEGKQLVSEIPRTNGTEAKVDIPSAYVTLSREGKKVGTFLLTAWLDEPTRLSVDGKPFALQLRFKRYYKSYSMKLLKFTHDKYVGTETPKDYASTIQLVDPTRGEDRQVRIWMNNPLRFAGETFYQSSFVKPEQNNGTPATVLQIVRNPGWLMPYVACVVGTLGLLVHFGMALFNFLDHRTPDMPPALPVPQAAMPVPQAAMPGPKKARRRAATSGDATPEASGVLPLLLPALTLVCGLTLSLVFLMPAQNKTAFDLQGFGALPVSFEGRTQPLDSLARNSLKVISGGETLQVDGKSTPAIQWLAETLSATDAGLDLKVVRIDHPDLLGMLGLEPGQKTYSARQVLSNEKALSEQLQLVQRVERQVRDEYQRRLAELGNKLEHYMFLRNMADLYLVPPLASGEQWRSMQQASDEARKAGGMAPAAQQVLQILDAYRENKPEEFNTLVRSYQATLDKGLPATVSHVAFEKRFNQYNPFRLCLILYVGVFLLAVGSWIGLSRPLVRSALILLAFTLLIHTVGLVCRIYISGRPPVTNLASSAIFIAWGGALLAAGLEYVYRNGVGSVAAAVIGFLSLLIADRLALDGDTMKVLQAVLDTNFWLATHVVVITLGYSATFLAGLLAIIYVLRGVLSSNFSADESKDLSRMIYGVVCFATLFSFVGTILGGIWADQSWGRFWGWDPKENGAVLIVLWNALLLHARWGGVVRARGVALLAVGGNVVTAWSWFGTNMLGVGLHSYGFMDSALMWLLVFVGSQLLIIGLGAIPLDRWRSYVPPSTPGFPMTPRKQNLPTSAA